MIEIIDNINKEVFMIFFKLIGKLFLYSFIFIFSIIVFFCAFVMGVLSGQDYIFADHNKEYIEICMTYGYSKHRCINDIF